MTAALDSNPGALRIKNLFIALALETGGGRHRAQRIEPDSLSGDSRFASRIVKSGSGLQVHYYQQNSRPYKGLTVPMILKVTVAKN